ncbi:MAG: hypothetical protein JO212_09080, partial [Acetobacteraceae bacterium]|nr:hypothetical protein [Acetobacteraceae bacterium]
MNTAATADMKMMRGTNHTPDYLVVARLGDIGPGVKILGILPGKLMGFPDRAYLHVRIRSAHAGDLFAESDAAAGVTQFPMQLDLDEAWPNIEFAKVDTKRASTIA